MNLKLHGNNILCTDIDPAQVIGEFNSSPTKIAKARVINDHNFGRQMIEMYKQSRDNMHVVNVVDLLEKLESIYLRWDEEDYRIRKLMS